MNALNYYESTQREAAKVVAKMESNGIQLDLAACNRGVIEQALIQDELQERLDEWTGGELNWASTQQRADFFYTVKGWSVPPICGNVRAVKKTQPGSQPTDEMACIYLAQTVSDPTDREMLRLYVGWRDDHEKQDTPAWKISEKLAGFYEGLPKQALPTGRIHPQLGATTATGRLSCRNPNLQQQPMSVRNVFVAGEGNALLAMDYAGLEWRVLAHILVSRYNDRSLLEEILEGVDPHTATARGIGKVIGRTIPRAHGKILNYSINYGKTEKGLALQLGISVEEAQQLLQAFYEARPGIKRWHFDCVEYARDRGYCRSLLGRYRPIPDIRSKHQGKRKAAERIAMNSPIQMSATDIVTMAMIRCSELNNAVLRGLDCKMILSIHDELLFEVPDRYMLSAKAEVKEQMENCLVGVRDFHVPLAVEGGYGKTWQDCK